MAMLPAKGFKRCGLLLALLLLVLLGLRISGPQSDTDMEKHPSFVEPSGAPAIAPSLPEPCREKGKELPDPILVDDFETGQTHGLFAQRKNRLDAFQGTWARRPSYTVITKVLDSRPGSVGNALRLEYNKVGGWCGWYTLLNGIDISCHNALTFWVKGEEGGERFDIGLADDTMQDLQIDAVYVGSIKSFLPEGITTQWQQVKIPLQSLRSELNLTRMGSLVLWFRYEGKGAIEVDDLVFAFDEEIERILEENMPRAQLDIRSPRAMWVWKYDPINNLDVREELLAFSERTAIQRFYLYLGEEPIPQTPENYQQGLAEFLRQCHAQGIEVQALQGNPVWALKRHHSKVLKWIGGFLTYNRTRPPEEWIDGVHMDIEPYLTSEWETGDQKKLKEEFLELMASCRELIDEENGRTGARASTGSARTEDAALRPWAVGPTAAIPFVMGLAIPLFYDREPEMERKLLAFLDYAALMDYYDTARDIIDAGWSHVEMARELGVAMVIGIETQDLIQMSQGKRRNTFIEEGWNDMEAELAEVTNAFAGNPAFDGLAIHCYYAYKILQRGRNVPTRERTGKLPGFTAAELPLAAQIDGDLSEWNQAQWTRIFLRKQAVYGVGAWEGPNDYSFKVAAGWEPEALLLAFDVTDNTHIQEKQKADMWEGDHLELWLDTDLEGDYAEAVNSSDDFQLGLSPGNFSTLPPEAHVWVPSVDPDALAGIQVAARNTEAGYALEVRLPTDFLFQNVRKRVGVGPVHSEMPKRITPEMFALQEGVLQSHQLTAGFRMGIMVDGSDSDLARHPQKCVLSTSEERQWGDPTTFNILELR